MALLVAMGLTGVGYAMWYDIVTINGTMETGTWGVVLSNLTCSASVSCSAAGNVLEVTVTNAQLGTGYSCNFTITSTGTIPVKMLVDPLSVPLGVATQIINITGDGIIDPGETETGGVHISLQSEPPVNPSKGQTFTVTVSGVPWNQYVP